MHPRCGMAYLGSIKILRRGNIGNNGRIRSYAPNAHTVGNLYPVQQRLLLPLADWHPRHRYCVQIKTSSGDKTTKPPPCNPISVCFHNIRAGMSATNHPFENISANNRFQRTAHKVRRPLNRDVGCKKYET